jgi:transketolase
MDHNKVQSDRPVKEIISLGDIAEKIRGFGWHVVHMDGHDFAEIERTFNDLKSITNMPKFIIADTIKGKGVSFMEHPAAIKAANGLYPWHAGAPDDDSFTQAYLEIVDRINKLLTSSGNGPIKTRDVDLIQKKLNAYIPLNALGEPVSSAAPLKNDKKRKSEYVVEAFGQALLKEGAERSDIVVLDADLSSDCRLRYFENKFPDRFIENGIAEQDMVSMAGGLAKMGFLPVVNSFASFLASRSNEQIYNNCTEKNKVIYACHYAGLIPAGPGKSHQSIRDISLLAALPDIEIIQPCNSSETEMVVDYCVNHSMNNCVIRMNISPSPRYIELPDDYKLRKGYGVTLMKGSDAVIISYGPVMLNEALNASELLAANGFMLEVINMPWLNVIDAQWLNGIVSEFDWIFVLEDHSPVGGLADSLLRQIVKARLALLNHFQVLSIEGYPACGTPMEALKYHGLDGESIAMKIKSLIYGE